MSNAKKPTIGWLGTGPKALPITSLHDAHRVENARMISWRETKGHIRAGVFCANEPLMFVSRELTIAYRVAFGDLGAPDGTPTYLRGDVFVCDLPGQGANAQPLISSALYVGCPINPHESGHLVSAVLLTLALNQGLSKIGIDTVTPPN